MKIIKYKLFEKSLQKAPVEIKISFNERIKVFYQNTTDMILDNHPLHGKYTGCRSIKITGNWRVIYKEINKDTIILINIGTHSQLYGQKMGV